MYPGNSETITVCREVYQINQVLSKSVSTSSVLSWYMGNVHRSVPLMLFSTRIHTYIHTYICIRLTNGGTTTLMNVHLCMYVRVCVYSFAYMWMCTSLWLFVCSI